MKGERQMAEVSKAETMWAQELKVLTETQKREYREFVIDYIKKMLPPFLN